MDKNEDEPVDVQKAAPVKDEIVKGEKDEESDKPRQQYVVQTTKLHKCSKKSNKDDKKLVKTREECCQSKMAKYNKLPKTAKVFVYEKPCILSNPRPIPRHCLSKQEWINLLATPSQKCPPACVKKIEERPLRPISPRINKLALPPRPRMLATLQDRGAILPAELVDKLIQVLEADTCLTPEQAENLFQDTANKSKKKRRKKDKVNCKSDLNNREEYAINSSFFDERAVNCQYSMADTFVKSILQWKCTIPKEEFRDIADVIVKRLENILEYPALKEGDRMSQQMKFLADIVASWIAGVLFDVAKVHEKELEKECNEKRHAKAEETDDDSEESEKEIVIEPKIKVIKKPDLTKDDNNEDEDEEPDTQLTS